MGNALPSQVEEHIAQITSPIDTVAGVRTKIDISGQQDVGSNSVQALSGRYVTVLMNNGDNVPLNLKEVRAYGKAGRRFGLYVCKPQSFID